MEENKIIEAEYREVQTGGVCELNRLTTEIRYITEQLNRTLLSGIIEIGKRFERAKALVAFGQWGDYCEEMTGYSQSMAENYIKVYREYGADQQSLFGDLSNSQSLGNLGITKLLELTALPPDERESFVEENNVTADTTVKELQELIKKQNAAAEDAEMKFRIKEQDLNSAIRRNNDVITKKQEEIDRLTAELERRKNEPRTEGGVSNDEMEKLIREAEENVKAKTEKTISKLKGEKQKLLDEQNKLKQRLEDAQSNSEEADIAAKREIAELKSEIERLKKESLLGSNENLVRLNMLFESAQADISGVKAALDKLKGADNYEKLREAVAKTLTAAAEGI